MEQAEFTMILRAVYIPKLIVKVLGTFPILAAMLLYRKNLVYIIALATFIVCLSIFMIVSTAYYCDECELKTAKRWWKYTGIAGIISMVLTILVPSRSTCYQIFGVTIATEVIKNSEALQELPEKSFEVINRLLDSIASEDKKEGN